MAISTIGTSSISGLGYGFKNRIINGACAINQRGSSFASNNTSGYFVDRMWGFRSSDVATFSQASSTGLAGFPYAMRMQRNAANAGVSPLFAGQIVESNNLQDLQGQAVSISFYAKAGANFSASGNTLTVYLRTGTVADQGLAALIGTWTGQVDQTQSVTITSSWQRYTVTTFSVASTTQELSVFFSYTPTGTAGASDYVDITGVQLEKGNVATSFDYRPYGTELALCQRYYQTGSFVLYGPGGQTTGLAGQWIVWPVVMRSSPTVTAVSPSYTNSSGLGMFNANSNGFSPAFTVAGSNASVSSGYTSNIEL